MGTATRYFLGIDPGKSGGIAVVDELGILVLAAKMPDTVGDLLELLRAWGPTATRPAAVGMLERVNAGVFGGGKIGRMGVSSAFTFGRGIGRLETALQACMIPFDQVAPAVWQQALGCRSGGDKNITKGRAQQLFPLATVTHAIADALLLAEFCRRAWRAGSPRGLVPDGEKGSPDAGAEKESGDGQGHAAWIKTKAIADTFKRQIERAAATVVTDDGASTRSTDGRNIRAPRRRARRGQ